jgi:hypothetical protein
MTSVYTIVTSHDPGIQYECHEYGAVHLITLATEIPVDGAEKKVSFKVALLEERMTHDISSVIQTVLAAQLMTEGEVLGEIED